MAAPLLVDCNNPSIPRTATTKRTGILAILQYMKQAWSISNWRRKHSGKTRGAHPSAIRYLDIIHPPVISTRAQVAQRIKHYLLTPPSPKKNRKSKQSLHRNSPKAIPINTRGLQIPLPQVLAHLTPSAVLNKLSQLPRISLFLLSISVVLGISYAGYQFSLRDNTPPILADSTINTSLNAPTLERGTPPYRTLAPKGKDIEADLGGWARISPEGRDPVYAYADTLEGTSMAVSQQPIPDEFKSDVASHVDRLARDFGATEKITVDGITIHIGSTIEGPQSIIFSKDNLLILIKSTDRISNEQWSSYITSLR